MLSFIKNDANDLLALIETTLKILKNSPFRCQFDVLPSYSQRHFFLYRLNLITNLLFFPKVADEVE